MPRCSGCSSLLASVEDRGHLLSFAPTPPEVHRRTAEWFWDQEVFDFIGAHLHLPAWGPTVHDVRPHLPAGRWVSAAIHDADEARLTRGADLALVSPVYAPGSKPEDSRAPLGPEGFRALAASLTCPAMALGGITPERAVLLPEAQGFAVISAVLEAEDPARAARALLQTTLSRNERA